ncbi:Farnesyl pyrophosphate synthase [Trichoplax sp. H2]|nr:Farnesyl pyrophosphate synthase [Trichoplax sp. H2]|eukprot:RDD43531.1 Farnesyl pyrophosphate synthase [Trichoplax sp. H2]
MADAKKPKLGDNDATLFDQLFPQLVTELTEDGLANDQTVDAIQWMKKSLECNVPGGKRNRGLSVIATVRLLVAPQELSDEDIKGALVLGWCVEFLQAFFLVADDIMDDSVTRRGQPCWFRNPEIGTIAINDSFMIESCIYKLLKKYFRSQPYYADLLDLMHETTYDTEVGQTLDLITAPSYVDFSRFSIERYRAIVKYKTAIYSFYLPVALAMTMTKNNSEVDYQDARQVLMQMGEYFQIQDDFLDCFGDPKITGKIGTDIEDNKCSWLVVQALSIASEEQKKVLQDNYAKNDQVAVQKVKDLYNELNLKQRYNDYEEQSYATLSEGINKIANQDLAKALHVFAKRIYKRKA